MSKPATARELAPKYRERLTVSRPADAPRARPADAPRASYDQVSWRDSAACRYVDTELFFPIGKAGAALAEGQQAKRICAGCPVRQACLTFALSTNQLYGIWGGYDEDERRLLLRQRQHNPAPPRV